MVTETVQTASRTVKSLRSFPIPHALARQIIEREHYLHAMPGGTCLAFGVFLADSLRGAITFGVGPSNVHRLVSGAGSRDCLTLTRLWLSDSLPRNSESHVIGQTLRSLRRETAIKFVVSYADPAAGHSGTIYQASNWLYTGLSQAAPMFDMGDGVQRHSRSLAHAFGTRSIRHFGERGVTLRRVPQGRKHRYLIFLDRRLRPRLLVPVLPYPKGANSEGQ